MNTIIRIGIIAGCLAGVTGVSWGQGRGRPAPVDPVLGETGGSQHRGAPAAVPGITPQQGGESGAARSTKSLIQRLSVVVDPVLAVHAFLRSYIPSWAAWVSIGAAPVVVLFLLLGLVRRGRGPVSRKPRDLGIDEGPSLSETEDSLSKANEKTGKSVTLSAESRMVLHKDGQTASMHETYTALGADALVLESLSELTALKVGRSEWDTALSEQNPGALRPLLRAWTKDVATRRVAQWLARHPQIQNAALRVVTPAVHESAELENLTLTRADGMGAELDADQSALLGRARQALAVVYDAADNPYAVLRAAAEANIADLEGLRRGEGSASMPDALATSLLLHGQAALDRAVKVGVGQISANDELRAALQEHEQHAGSQVPGEGCAVYALAVLGGQAASGVGTLLAAMAGGAYSASAVTLRVSKIAAGMRSAEQRNALGKLGKHLVKLIAIPPRGDWFTVMQNLKRLLGLPVLEAEAVRAVETARLAARVAKSTSGNASPVPVLLRLHQQLIEHTKRQVEAAELRAGPIFQRLAYVGQRGESREIAHRRVGYAVAGFGTELVRSTSTDLLSTARETIATIR